MSRANELEAFYRIAIERGFVSENDVRQQLAVHFVSALDQVAYDTHPDDCWRCDARPADGPVGPCMACRQDLTEK